MLILRFSAHDGHLQAEPIYEVLPEDGRELTLSVEQCESSFVLCYR